MHLGWFSQLVWIGLANLVFRNSLRNPHDLSVAKGLPCVKLKKFWKRQLAMFLTKSRIITLLSLALASTLLGPILPASSNTDVNEFIDSSFATDGTFNFLDIFGDSPLTEGNSVVSPIQVDRIAIDSEDRIVVLASFKTARANGVAIGTGYMNSLAIAAQSGNIAESSAGVAALAYSGGGQNDWYLPSEVELGTLLQESGTVGLVEENATYWSSTEDDRGAARVYSHGTDPGPGLSLKFNTNAVRPIRAGTLGEPTVGHIGAGGGQIFYVDTLTPFACGPTLLEVCNYLEAAPDFWYSSDGDPFISWATDISSNAVTEVLGADRNAIGAGFKNSLAIAAQQGNIEESSAAVLARSYSSNVSSIEYNDWYLPSKDELTQLFDLPAEEYDAHGLSSDAYWSSTEGNALSAFGAGRGYDFVTSKREEFYVRPIRAGTLSNPTLGDIGPGGGRIFYADISMPFPCGPFLSESCNYLEAAPIGWYFGSQIDPVTSWATDYLSNVVTSVRVDKHIIFRLNADGSYDNTFGSVETTLRKDVTDEPKRYVLVTTTGIAYVEKVDLEIDSEDRILVMLSGYLPNFGSERYHNFVARYESNGVIDEDFGDNGGSIGTLYAQYGDPNTLFSDLTLDSLGRLVIASLSTFRPVSTSELLVQRFLQSGLLDNSFGIDGNGGVVSTSTGESYVRNLQIIADGANGYIAAYTSYFFSDDPLIFGLEFFTEITRFVDSGTVDVDFNLEIAVPDTNIIPGFSFTDLAPDGPTDFLLTGTYFPNGLTSGGDSSYVGTTVRLNIDGSRDQGFSGEDGSPAIDSTTNCVNTTLTKNNGSNRSDVEVIIGDACFVNGSDRVQLGLKLFALSGEIENKLSFADVIVQDNFIINQLRVTSDNRLLILSGAEPFASAIALVGNNEDSSYSSLNISRWQLNSPPIVNQPISAPQIAPIPILVPYLRTLTAPKMHLKDSKLICSAGTYNAGYTLSGVNQGSATTLTTPSSFTYKIFIDGVSQDSITAISESATASWKLSVARAGALVTCSVTASANGVSNLDRSTDNNVGVSTAMDARISEIARAQISYPESLTANSKAYQKALVDNRAKWRSDTEKNRRDYRSQLEKIKSLPRTAALNTSAASAMRIYGEARKKSLNDYKAGIPGALVAKELADRNALVFKETSITNAITTYGTYIESIGYGVLIP